jgi:arylsulfatase A-like enzyme
MKWRVLTAPTVLAAAVVLSCGGPRPRGLVLVSIDTLRPDRLGCYGGSVPASPAIDALRRESILFEAARAHAPSTLLSHASVFTSRVPQRHGASHLRRIRIPEAHETLATKLRSSGFRTAAIHGGGQLAAEFGFDRGFEIYEQEAGPFRAAVARGLSWLQSLPPQARYLLFLHTYEVHHPYEPAPALLARVERAGYRGQLPSSISVRLLERINRGRLRIDAADLRHIVATYDAEILSVDRGVADLVRGLARVGRLDEAVVVLTSDHGEEFGEHGRVGWHSHSLYEELLRVPLLIRLPRAFRGGTTVGAPFRLVDLAPTLVALLGEDAPASFEGEDRRELLSGAPERVPAPLAAFGEVEGRSFEGLVAGRWKLAGSQLFDLEADPGEHRDLASSRPRTKRALESLLRDLAGGAASQGDRAPVSDETRESLRALGYS